MLLTQEEVVSLLDYNPATGVFVWRHRDEGMFPLPRQGKVWNGKYAGKEAGRTSFHGYREIGIYGVLYRAHRIAWLYVHGAWPEKHIDHIDHDRTNNRISNLRAVTVKENQRNRSKSPLNKSGVTGVFWEKRHKRWVAFIRDENQVKYLGEHKEKSSAVAARKAAEVEYGYHQNHGI